MFFYHLLWFSTPYESFHCYSIVQGRNLQFRKIKISGQSCPGVRDDETRWSDSGTYMWGIHSICTKWQMGQSSPLSSPAVISLTFPPAHPHGPTLANMTTSEGTSVLPMFFCSLWTYKKISKCKLLTGSWEAHCRTPGDSRIRIYWISIQTKSCYLAVWGEYGEREQGGWLVKMLSPHLAFRNTNRDYLRCINL